MKIIDNFLTEKNHKQIKEHLCGGNFPWKKSTILPSSMFDLDQNLNVQFVHRFVYVRRDLCNGVEVFYDLQKSEYFYLIEPLLDLIQPKEILRAKANLTINHGIRAKTGFHVDVAREIYCGKGMTGVYYVNTNNGATVFENGEQVDSIENRLVIFPNHWKHSSLTHTDTPYRVVINLNWL
jgi:hypothetical protein